MANPMKPFEKSFKEAAKYISILDESIFKTQLEIWMGTILSEFSREKQRDISTWRFNDYEDGARRLVLEAYIGNKPNHDIIGSVYGGHKGKSTKVFWKHFVPSGLMSEEICLPLIPEERISPLSLPEVQYRYVNYKTPYGAIQQDLLSVYLINGTVLEYDQNRHIKSNTKDLEYVPWLDFVFPATSALVPA
jgi:hypothetical protein